ncbi:MAG: TRAP transporter small permease [Rubrivivax sp.]|nr:TRAP transporter small permease [Burkholderiales bacterium]MCW5635190.1 TRAP transporter small permease [Rubrivivax sp.]
MLRTWIAGASEVFRWGALLTVAAMALLITVSVAMRAAATPLGGEHEVVELMMVAVVMLGMAPTQSSRGHISIGLVVDRLSPRAQARCDVLAAALVAATCLVVGWANLRTAWEYATESPMSTDFLSVPLYPFKALVGVGFLLWGLQALLGVGVAGDGGHEHPLRQDGT